MNRLKKNILTYFLIMLSSVFTNCSKFVPTEERLNSNEIFEDDQNNNNGNNFKLSCNVIQISSEQIFKGSTLDYSVSFSGNFDSFNIICDQEKINTPITNSNFTTPILHSLQNLEIGNHSCLIVGQQVNQKVTCAGTIFARVLDNSTSLIPIDTNPTELRPAPIPDQINTQDDQFNDMIPQFKEQLNPDSSIQLIQAGESHYRLQIVDSGRIGKKVKFFAPPGTVQIASNLLVVSAAKAVWKFKTPPTTSAQSLSGEKLFNYGQTLVDELQSEKELFFSTENSGMLPFDTGSGGISNPLIIGGYVYIDLNYSSWPTFTTTLIIEKQCYDRWYKSNSTQWKNSQPLSTSDHKCR